MSTSTLRKTAIDEIAKRYWEEYFKESGYGATWVKDVPRRVAAELQAREPKKAGKSASKTASPSPEIRPLATVITESGVSLEGLAVYPSQAVKAFVVDFDHRGNVSGFDVVDAK